MLVSRLTKYHMHLLHISEFMLAFLNFSAFLPCSQPKLPVVQELCLPPPKLIILITLLFLLCFSFSHSWSSSPTLPCLPLPLCSAPASHMAKSRLLAMFSLQLNYCYNISLFWTLPYASGCFLSHIHNENLPLNHTMKLSCFSL